jgi:hypothetical protein
MPRSADGNLGRAQLSGEGLAIEDLHLAGTEHTRYAS